MRILAFLCLLLPGLAIAQSSLPKCNAASSPERRHSCIGRSLSFVAFATAPGRVALDGSKGQRNSPFTKSLLKAIQTPDLPIELMFKEVRRLVVEETKNEQVPWDNSSLVGDFVFRRTK